MTAKEFITPTKRLSVMPNSKFWKFVTTFTTGKFIRPTVIHKFMTDSGVMIQTKHRNTIEILASGREKQAVVYLRLNKDQWLVEETRSRATVGA